MNYRSCSRCKHAPRDHDDSGCTACKNCPKNFAEAGDRHHPYVPCGCTGMTPTTK